MCSWYLIINGKCFCNYIGCFVLIDKRICWLESYINYGFDFILKCCCFLNKIKEKLFICELNKVILCFNLL